MKLAIINPNATTSMSTVIEAAAQAVAAPDVEIRMLTNEGGPESIQGVLDAARATPGLLRLIGAHNDADAFIVACFDDSGLDAARCVASGPVIGIGEAGCHAASLVAHRFSIVTTLARSAPVLRNNLAIHGLSHKCASVIATDIPVLALEHPTEAVLHTLETAVSTAIARDGAEAIVLGCAGMSALADHLRQKFDLPVIDGVASAVGLATALIRMRLSTSRQGFYALPL